MTLITPSDPAKKAKATGYYLLPAALRNFVRSRETGLVSVAIVIGLLSGLLVAAISKLSEVAHALLFDIPFDAHLSSTGVIPGNATSAGLVPVIAKCRDVVACRPAPDASAVSTGPGFSLAGIGRNDRANGPDRSQYALSPASSNAGGSTFRALLSATEDFGGALRPILGGRRSRQPCALRLRYWAPDMARCRFCW